MKAWVFSIGEPTTELCVKQIERAGHDVTLLQDDTNLWRKLWTFYNQALETGDEECMRVDADIIPNDNVVNFKNESGWTAAFGYDWYKQDGGSISIHIMKREIIELCAKHIQSAKYKNRPETWLWRIDEINPHTKVSDQGIFGVHGYSQTGHRDRIKKLKQSRGQEYNWNLVQEIESL